MVESEADRLTFLLDFGVAVTWTRGAVAQPAVLAIFSRPTATTPGLSEVDLIDRGPTITLPEAYLPSGATEDDPVSIVDEFGTHAYRCKTIRPDGSGFCTVDLKA